MKINKFSNLSDKMNDFNVIITIDGGLSKNLKGGDYYPDWYGMSAYYD